MTRITQIGIVKNNFDVEDNPHEIKKHESEIIIQDEFLEGLYRVEEYVFMDIVFAFDRSESYEMKATTLRGNYKGLFATRKPHRPSSIGITTVRLLKVDKNTLTVTGLDALNNSPVLDIKPVDLSMIEDKMENLHFDDLKMTPRKDVVNDILKNDLKHLMIQSAAMHGHYCPGIALGVMAATKAMQLIRVNSDGLEDLVAITETNNCFSDGIQFVTGCSFGNNGLIFKDLGKTAFSLVKRDGKGIRISSTSGSREYLRQASPLFSESYKSVVKGQDHSQEEILKFKQRGKDRAFSTLALDFDKLFVIEEIEIKIPEYAPSNDSVLCDECGESIMSTRMDENLCLSCSGGEYNQLDGHGIHSMISE